MVDHRSLKSTQVLGAGVGVGYLFLWLKRTVPLVSIRHVSRCCVARCDQWPFAESVSPRIESLYVCVMPDEAGMRNRTGRRA